jgi:hypothetical protein
LYEGRCGVWSGVLGCIKVVASFFGVGEIH